MRLLSLRGADEGAAMLDVDEDERQLRLPSGPDGSDNYVVGIALDTTCVDVRAHAPCCS